MVSTLMKILYAPVPFHLHAPFLEYTTVPHAKEEHYVTLINSALVLEMIACEEIDDFSSKADGFHSRLWDKCVNSEARFSHFHYVGKGSALYMFIVRNYAVPSKLGLIIYS